jgi:hypothetical protein
MRDESFRAGAAGMLMGSKQGTLAISFAQRRGHHEVHAAILLPGPPGHGGNPERNI